MGISRCSDKNSRNVPRSDPLAPAPLTCRATIGSSGGQLSKKKKTPPLCVIYSSLSLSPFLQLPRIRDPPSGSPRRRRSDSFCADDFSPSRQHKKKIPQPRRTMGANHDGERPPPLRFLGDRHDIEVRDATFRVLRQVIGLRKVLQGALTLPERHRGTGRPPLEYAMRRNNNGFNLC